MQRAHSAPSKLFLSGEYAVLWGGVARVLAVGPRAHSLVRTRDDRQVEVLTAEGRLRGLSTPLGVRWEDEVTADVRFAARALDVAYRAGGREALGLSLALAPSRHGPKGEKLGTGTSARTAVLAMEAASFALGLSTPLPLALLAHAEAQAGQGSGADVVACAVGGLVRYRRWPVEKALSPGVALPLAIRDAGPVDVVRTGLAPAFPSYASTGKAAKTPLKIEEAERVLDVKGRRTFVEESDVLGEALEEALHAGNFSALKEVCEELQKLLASLDGVVTAELERILLLAKASSSTGKVSGAGGGDGCVLLSPDAETQQRLLESLNARGIFAFPLTVEAGVHQEVEADGELASWLAA